MFILTLGWGIVHIHRDTYLLCFAKGFLFEYSVRDLANRGMVNVIWLRLGIFSYVLKS